MNGVLTASLTEAQYQANITDLCDWLGLTWFHTPDSRRSNPGWPDLAVLNLATGSLLFIECKAEKGRIRPRQAEVLFALERGGHDVILARPSDWGDVQRRLRDLAVAA